MSKSRNIFVKVVYQIMERKELTQRKYEDIRLAFQKWSDKRYKNVRIYTEDYILERLSEKFYLAPKTIENIVYHRVASPNNQLSLFV